MPLCPIRCRIKNFEKQKRCYSVRKVLAEIGPRFKPGAPSFAREQKMGIFSPIPAIAHFHSPPSFPQRHPDGHLGKIEVSLLALELERPVGVEAKSTLEAKSPVCRPRRFAAKSPGKGSFAAQGNPLRSNRRASAVTKSGASPVCKSPRARSENQKVRTSPWPKAITGTGL